MADEPQRPLLNPVLSLKIEPKPETQPGGGKNRDSIRTDRLAGQQQTLSSAAMHLHRMRARLPLFGEKTHLLVRMFAEDSLAPSYTPTDLFGPPQGCQLVAPFRNGYLVEAEVEALPRLAQIIQNPPTIAIQCDISRVKTLSRFSRRDRLRRHTLDELWEAAPANDQGHLFVVWFAPFRNRNAQEELLQKIESLSSERVLLPTFTTVRLLTGPGETGEAAGAVTTPSQSSIARALRGYRNTGVSRASVRIPTKQAFSQILSSGVSHRIDPVRPIRVAAPGEGTEPVPPGEIGDAPIVGVVDGGLHAQSYAEAEAWRAPPLVSNAQADRRHGNAISSLIVQGYAWNTNRPLPALNCRVGTVQAVPQLGANRQFDERELVDYLAAVMRAHPETRVWNISANQETNDFDAEEVSVLGYELNELARAAGILPIISIGNTRPGGGSRPNPPADCDAAIVVGGRQADAKGKPGTACRKCLSGPGPDGMLKPDVSWYSQLRMIGGVIDTGSSYPTALVSSLAAHTVSNLRDPSPDLAKALIINASERESHDPSLGWGTPYHGYVPWICEPGSVTLAWRAQLDPGASYYWNDIPIPRELIRNGKLFGRARLTAILRPLVSPFGGANYFASRLQTSLRYQADGEWKPLLGTMLESTLKEQDARDDLKKWQPVRRHYRDFRKRTGLNFEGNSLQLYARVFTRDLYQFEWSRHRKAGGQEVTFVLTFWSADNTDPIYNSMVQELGNFVESAVINQDIEVSNE
jgi:hypothetical protein